ncbi:ComEA family DNA-binding protein [Cohnella sp. JJ-181]|uniref:ComEA family DNA-binding protein n=1 Tax=Cohnella rhizoplanae TaxID=2974897 RepID=UPI0022FF9357|nr:helix-hairpin-helix domain-containing protein [Cohnella sp. JJ-181]CAI6016412.1 hypothetical protein COHCIP112018_00125 [Cohnella sp. JJ-181]
MATTTVRESRLRRRAALLAGTAAAALLAWGWLKPADGGVPGWEPVNAQVAAAVATAERAQSTAAAGPERDQPLASAAEAGDGQLQPAIGAVGAGGKAPAVEKNAGLGLAEPAVTAAGPSPDAASAEAARADMPAGANGATSPPPADGRLDINRASAAELDGLPGIGPAKAEAIVQYRNANGRFGSADELKNVKGIGDKLLAKLLPLVTAG